MDYESVMRDHGEIVYRRARQFSRILNIPFEDAVQEASLALFRILPGFDAQRGPLETFIDVRVRGHLCKLRRRHLKTVSLFLRANPDGEGEGEMNAGYQILELADQVRLLQMKLLNRLSGREKQIWTLFATPPEHFQNFLDARGEEEPSREAVAAFLGLGLEPVKYALRSIRRQMTLIFDGPDFSDLTESAIARHVWPLVYVSPSQNDREFVTSILMNRQLQLVPTHTKSETGISCTRMIEFYPWGVVMYLTHGLRHATIVCEGNFCDDRDGHVGSDSGFWRNISDSLGWYRNARKALKAEA